MRKIAIGSDHGGFELKSFLIEQLNKLGYDMLDVGTDSTESCDYPLFGEEAAKLVASKAADFGILVCTSGEGIMIAANKIKGVRCGIGYNDEVSKLIRQHNDANMISFGAKFTSFDDALKRVLIFLNTDFEGGRHQRRVDEISSLEK